MASLTTGYKKKAHIKIYLISVLLILWACNSVTAANFELSIEEKQWLDKLPPLRVGVSNSWLPINFKGNEATHQGIASDYMKLVSKKLGLKLESTFGTWQELQIKIKAGEIDLLPSVAFSKEKQAYLHFTEPYLSMPTIIATRIDAPHYPNIDSLKEVVVGVGENFAVQARLKRDYPEINTRGYTTIEDAVLALDSGEVDALVTNATVYTYFQNKYKLKTSIHINNTTQYTDKIAIGVRHELAPLVPLLNRALADISDDERDLILDKWANLNISHQIDWTLAWQLALPVAIFVMMIFYSNRKMAAEIVKRKENEKKIESQQKLLDMAEKMAKIGGWELCLETNRLTWTDEIYNIFEVGDDFTPTVEKALNFYPPDSKVLIEKSLQSAMTTGEPYDLELEVKTAQGNQRWAHTMGQAIREGSTVTRILGSFQDITGRKQAEERLQKSHNALLEIQAIGKVGTWEYDFIEETGSWSPENCRILGYPENTIPTFELFLERVHPDDREKVMGNFEEGIKTGVFDIEYRLLIDDQTKWVHGKGIYQYHNNEPVRVVGFGQDITEKKLFQKAQLQSSQLAALGEVAAGVAHEINNPIQGVINYAQILINKNDGNDKTTQILERIIKEGDRIAYIVKNLLTFAHKDRSETSFFDLIDVVAEPLNLHTEFLKKDGIHVENGIPSDLPKIYGSQMQLEQVVLNLISNARYALNKRFPEPSNEKRIVIDATSSSAEGVEVVQLKFKDYGCGIPDDHLDKIFNPFFTTKAAGVGTGLGLSVCHEIIEKHGATISIDSKVGKFTEVTITFPVKLESVS